MTKTLTTVASASVVPEWHAQFVVMLPQIQRCAQSAFRNVKAEERQEAIQAVVAYAATAYGKLAQMDRAELGRITPLARYGVKQYRAGRLIGGAVNSLDVGSISCRHRGCRTEPIDDWKESLCESRGATPADIAALRIDFAEWFGTLTARDQRLAAALARGERTKTVAQAFKITAARVSQLRRELYQSWREFMGEAPVASG